MHETFSGAKVALFIGDRLLITLRDDAPDILCPNMWDLPGGGWENGETPYQTLHREVAEEVGLDMDEAVLLWERRYQAVHSVGWVMFYVARMTKDAEARIVFGNEGQGWKLVAPEVFLEMPDAVPSLPPRLRHWIADTGGLQGRK